MSKKIKKGIVNGITLTRVLATISMPILFSCLTAPVFLLLIGLILLTDALDGFLARKWKVSTLFGSFFDMSADKALGAAILTILSFSYPIMLIPLVLEFVIGRINVKSALKGSSGISSQIGRVKTWIMGLSMCSLLLIGATPELSNFISNIKFDSNTLNIDAHSISQIGNKLEEIINSIKINFVNISKNVLDFIKNNKEVIKNIAIPSAIVSETITTADYLNKYNKVKHNEDKLTKEDLIKYKEYIKSIMLDEKYYAETKEMPLYEKLTPPEYRKEEPKIKKLVLNQNKIVDK